MRTVIKVVALLVVLGAPIMAPEVLMQQAQAQNAAGLNDAQQQAFDAAMQGTPEEVAVKFQALLEANGDDLSVLKALTRAASNAAGNNMALRVALTRATQAAVANLPIPDVQTTTSYDDPFALVLQPIGSVYTLLYSDLYLVFAPQNETDVLGWWSLMAAGLPNGFLSAQYGWWEELVPGDFEACLLGLQYSMGPYGTVSAGVTSGC